MTWLPIRLRPLVPAALAALVLFPASLARASYDPLEELPVEDSAYDELESLATRFGSGGFFLHRRPWSLGEARAYLDVLQQGVPGIADDIAFRRVARTVDRSAEGATPPLWTRDEDDRAVEISPYVRAQYEENRARRPAIDRDYRIGVSASARVARSVLLYGDWYAGTSSRGGHGTPNFGTKFALVENVDFSSWLDRAYVAAGTTDPLRFRTTLGRSWVRWGPGLTGTLGVSDAAPAHERLGFDVGLLRGLSASWFVASLDATEGRYLAAHRLGLHLGDRIEIGVAEEARFDGMDQIFYYLIPAFPYTFIEKRVAAFTATNDTTNKFTKNNAMASVDFSAVLGSGLRWYGEFLLDDASFSSTFKPRQVAWQTGLHFVQSAGPERLVGLRAEYTRVYNFVYTVWHRHDFAHGGLPLGYELGPDAEQAAALVTLDWGVPWRLTIEGAWVRHGEGSLGSRWDPADGKVDNVPLSGTVERTLRGSVGARYQPSSGLTIEAAVGYSDVENAENLTGVDRGDVEGRVRVTFRR